MTTTRDVLVSARSYIERGWCQNDAAQTREGMAVWSDSPAACRWCAIGALNAVASDGKIREPARAALLSAIDATSVAEWNDQPGRTQAEVLDAFDRAIAAQETP